MGQFEDMSAFICVVEAGSISAAARRLGVVKSAISRRLSDLETRLGVQLLTRTTRQSSLTEAGRAYYERSVQILSDVADINAATSHSKKALSGVMKISAPLSFGLKHLAPALHEFRERHPDLLINMDFNDRKVELVEEGFDLAIRIGDLKDSSLIARKIAPIHLVVCASPDYLKHHGTPHTPQDLKGHDILHYGHEGRAIWTFTMSSGKTVSVTLPVRVISNNGDFLKDAAVKGHGITLAPSFIAYKEIKEGKLIPLLPDYNITPLNAYAIYPQTRHLPHKTRYLIDFLKETFGGKPYWD